MQRCPYTPRSDWARRCEAVGFDFHTIDGERYWDESAAYRFTLEQVEVIEAAAEDLHRRCLDLVDWIVRENHFAPFCLDDTAIAAIRASWRRRDPSLYGRFDFAWDGGSTPPKLLEYNADTPTALLEASVVQWYWLKDVEPAADQFNSLHEQLIARWAMLPAGSVVHFSCIAGHAEDEGTVRYLMDTALQAGLQARFVAIDDIGYDAVDGCFVDADNQRIGQLFKLYPWEWMWQEAFAAHVESSGLRFIEPAWKLLLSSKAMLPLLWEHNPGHPNLLPAAYEDVLGRPVVRKPLYSREGANIELLGEDTYLSTDGPYADQPSIFQAYTPLPAQAGGYAVLGVWIVGDRAAGVGIREDAGPITRNTSRFIPHYFTSPA